MTEEEKKEIVDAVIARINANTQAVEDLPTSDNLSDFTTLPVLGSDGSMKKLRADRLKGERGAAMTFAQLTESEKAQLKGEKGDKMTFADLTSEEKAQLKGEKGDALTFSMLTDEQKAQLKGQKGDPGDPTAANEAAEKANAASEKVNAALESKVDYSKLLSDIWVGTAADYDAITTKQEGTMYLIDDTATAGTTTAGSGTVEKMWYGTRNDYERLTAKDDNILYMLVEEF